MMNASANLVPDYFRFSLLPFLVGVIASQKINIGGELYLGELIAAFYVAVNFSKLSFSKSEKTIVGFALMWAMAQLVSDLLNKTEILDAVKGIFAPVVFVIAFVFLTSYAKVNFERLPSLLLGIAVGLLIYLLISPTEYFLFNFWKWGFGSAFLGVFVIYFSFFSRRKSSLLLFFVLTGFLGMSLYYDSRSLAIFPIVAALVYVNYYGRRFSGLNRFFSGPWVGVRTLIVALPAFFIFNSAASALFSSEAVLANFSSSAAAKYRTQATGDFGILLGGRSEVLVSAQAFLDKPLFGHGSWAKDKSGYLDDYSTLRWNLGYSLREDGGYEENEDNLFIPVHSFLMGALVWAGLLGGLFWLVLLNNVLRIFFMNLHILPFYYYVGMIGFIWNVFFSPFGADARWSTAVFLAAIFSFSNYLKSSARVVT